MAEPALQTAPLDPRKVITGLAYGGLGEGLEQLDLRAELTTDGWSLLMKAGRPLENAVAALCAALDISRTNLTRIADNKRTALEGVSLGAQMLRYLVSRDWSNEADAVAISTETLVVAPAMTRTDMIDLLDNLNAHATACRAAVLEPETGGSFTLFHLRDDPVRGSSLQAFLNAYRGRRAPVLSGYPTEFGTMFLPVAPPRDSLNAVAALIHAVPTLFDFTQEAQEGWLPDALLVAVARTEDLPDAGLDDATFYFDARRARFFGSAALSDRLKPSKMIAVVPVGDPDSGLKVLRRSLQDPDGQFAFPLRLRPDRSHLLTENDAPRLQEIKAERRVLDIQIRHLSAGLTKQCMMILLPDAAFDAMMRLLRDIVADSGTWDGIKYCHVAADWPGHETLFEGQKTEKGQGLHAFHFEAELAERVRLRGTFGRDDRIRMFWGDPSWSAVYSNRAEIELMVPFRTGLTPVPHAWEPERADAYLRETVEMWSDGAIRLSEGKPHVLLFHKVLGAADDALDLLVFDADGFRALSGDTITWFNAVRTHLARGPQDDTRIADIEAEDARAVAQAAVRDAEAIGQNAEEAAAALAVASDEMIAGFYAHLDKEIGGLVDEIRDKSGKITTLEATAKEMEAKYRYAKDKLDGVANADKAFATRASRYLASHQRELDLLIKTLREREAAFDLAATRTEQKIDDMRARLKALHKRWW